MTKLHTLIFFTLFLSQIAFSQGWEKAFSVGENSDGWSIAERTDGNLIVCHRAYYPENFETELFLTEFDSEGKLLSTDTVRTFQNSHSSDFSTDVVVMSDNSLVIGTEIKVFGNEPDGFLIKTDENLNTEWEIALTSVRPKELVGSNDSQIVVLGQLDNKLLVSTIWKIDGTPKASVNTTQLSLWSCGAGCWWDDTAWDGIITQGGNILICGNGVDGTFDASGQPIEIGDVGVLYLMSPDGSLLWNEKGLPPNLKSVVQTSDNEYFTISSPESWTDQKTELIRLDNFRNIVWKTSYENLVGEKIFTNSNDEAVIAGTKYDDDGTRQFFLKKTDGDGNEIWHRNYQRHVRNLVADAIQTSDGGFALIGRTENSDGLGKEVYLVKTDSNGLAFSNVIEGQVFYDKNNDCQLDLGEETLSNRSIIISGSENYKIKADDFGHFKTHVGKGNFEVTVEPLDSAWSVCQDFQVEFDDYFQSQNLEFLAQDTCPDFYNEIRVNSICGEGKGMATIETFGGAGNFNYSWDNGDVGTTAENLNSGLHFVTVQDGFCSAKDSFDMTFPKTYSLNQTQYFGGTEDEFVSDFLQDSDGNFIFTGWSESWNHDLTGALGRQDLILGKTDEFGNLIWLKNYGGSLHDKGKKLIQTDDGDFLIGGETRSRDGQVSEFFGQIDIWLTKTDSDGNLLWEKSFGSNRYEYFSDFKQTTDDGILLLIYSSSNNGDFSENFGDNDIWLIKTDNDGNKIWQKNYGGKDHDTALGMIEIPDGGFVILGETESSEGMVSENKGLIDFWMFKTDSDGNLLWEKTFGGSYRDRVWAWNTDSEGNILVIFAPDSEDGDFYQNEFLSAIWTVKISPDGEWMWGDYFQRIGPVYFTNIAETKAKDGFWLTGNGEIAKMNLDGEFEYRILTEGEGDFLVDDFIENEENRLVGFGVWETDFPDVKADNFGGSDIWFFDLNIGVEDTDFLGSDSIICKNSELVFDFSNSEISDYDIVWDDGSLDKNKSFTIEKDTLISAKFTSPDGCEGISKVMVTSHDLDVNFRIVDANCGMENGSVEVQIYSPYVSFEADWNDGFSGKFRDGLPEGYYQISVSDALCSNEKTAQIQTGNAPLFESKKETHLNHSGFIYIPEIEYSLKTPNGGGLFFVGNRAHCFDKNGNYLFSIIPNSNTNFKNVYVDKNGSIWITGSINESGNDNNLWFAEYDSNGILISEFSFGGSENDEGTALTIDEKGNVFVVGTSYSNDGYVPENQGGKDLWVMKFDEDLNLKYSKTFGGSANETPVSVAPLPNSKIVIGAQTASQNGDISNNKGWADSWILVLNKHGNLVWEKTFGGSKRETSDKLLVSEDRIYLVGRSDESWDGDFENLNDCRENFTFVARFDFAGNQEWVRVFSPGFLADSELDSDGNLVISRYDEFVKLDTDGEIIWRRKFDFGTGIIPTDDGGLLLAKIRAENINGWPGGFPNYDIYLQVHKFQNTNPPPPIDLGEDVFQCPFEPVQLEIQPESGFEYVWSNGMVGETISVSEPGFYSVSVTNASGCFSEDGIWVLFCNSPGEWDQFDRENPYFLSVFPNPIHDFFDLKIDLKEPSEVSISIFNSLGQKTKTVLRNENLDEGFFEFEIVSQDWQNGVYFIDYQVNKENAFMKIIKTD